MVSSVVRRLEIEGVSGICELAGCIHVTVEIRLVILCDASFVEVVGSLDLLVLSNTYIHNSLNGTTIMLILMHLTTHTARVFTAKYQYSVHLIIGDD